MRNVRVRRGERQSYSARRVCYSTRRVRRRLRGLKKNRPAGLTVSVRGRLPVNGPIRVSVTFPKLPRIPKQLRPGRNVRVRACNYRDATITVKGVWRFVRRFSENDHDPSVPETIRFVRLYPRRFGLTKKKNNNETKKDFRMRVTANRSCQGL